MNGLTPNEARVLTTRGDLVQAECRIVASERITWSGRAEMLVVSGYGSSGGSAADRKTVAVAMAKIEMSVRSSR